MASAQNMFTFIGRLARDPDLRYTQKGTAVCTFDIAVDRLRDETVSTDFFRCKAWAKLAEIIQEHKTKGDQMAVTGRIQQNNWIDNDNQKHFGFDFMVDSAYFLASARKKDENFSMNGQAPPLVKAPPKSNTKKTNNKSRTKANSR